MKQERIAVLDIGGTRIKAGLFTEGNLTQQQEIDTLAAQGASTVLHRATTLLAQFIPFDAIGISTAGQVDVPTGTIRYANENLPGYTGADLRGYFNKQFNVPCAVINDAYAAALGEGVCGAAKGVADYICVTYGTGVGGGVVLGGKPYYGTGGSANVLIGGLVTHPQALRAGDPFAGTYERFASATALVASAKALDNSLINGRAVFARLEEPPVRVIVDSWIDEVAAGLLSLLALFNVPMLVLGGGVLEQPYVITEVKKRVKALAIPGFEAAQITAAQLGNTAGLYGAFQMAQQLLSGTT